MDRTCEAFYDRLVIRMEGAGGICGGSIGAALIVELLLGVALLP
jgi:hypothetical protein